MKTNLDYTSGFADGADLSRDEAAEQISAMGTLVIDDWDDYNAGYHDGVEFEKIWLP